MKVGDRVTRVPVTFHTGSDDDEKKLIRRPVVGRVVYIHPAGRYHVVEFALRGVPVRESFLGVER